MTERKSKQVVRRFSRANPVEYLYTNYPSTIMPVEDVNGNVADTTVFADGKGQYFTQDKDFSAIPIILNHDVPEVTVAAPQGKRNYTDNLTKALNKSLTGVPNDLFTNPNRHVELVSMEDANNNLQKQAMMKAAGYNVVNDGIWSSQDEKAWNTLTTKNKEYDATINGLQEGLSDKFSGNTTYNVDPTAPDQIQAYNPDNVDYSLTRKSQNKFIKALDGTYIPIAETALLPGAALKYPLASAASLAGGMAGGELVNAASEALTGRDFGTNVSMYTPLTPKMGDLFNPGTYIGGYKGYRRLLDSVYNQVTPISYTNDAIVSDALPKSKELLLAAKDFFTPKRIDTSPTTYPAWMQRALNSRMTAQDPMLGYVLQQRNDAWRMALRQKPRTMDINGKPHSLYIKNPDGTYRYDLDYINKRRADAGMQPLTTQYIKIPRSYSNLHEGKNIVVIPETIGHNGGFSGMEFSLPKNWESNNVTANTLGTRKLYIDKPFRLYDKWDIQPLKDEYRSFIPPITKFANKHPNIFTNYLKNAEGIQWLGGKPFVLDMKISPNDVGDIYLPSKR